MWMKVSMDEWWNSTSGQNQGTRRISCPTSALFTINLKCTGPEENLGPRGDRLVTNRLIHGQRRPLWKSSKGYIKMHLHPHRDHTPSSWQRTANECCSCWTNIALNCRMMLNTDAKEAVWPILRSSICRKRLRKTANLSIVCQTLCHNRTHDLQNTTQCYNYIARFDVILN